MGLVQKYYVRRAMFLVKDGKKEAERVETGRDVAVESLAGEGCG